MAMGTFARRAVSRLRPYLLPLRRLSTLPSLPSPRSISSKPQLPSPPPLPFSSNPSTNSTDLEVYPSEPITSPTDPQLRHLLNLIMKARGGDFPSKGDALSFLRASGVAPTRELVLSAMWELRGDWESGLLALQWGEECVGDCLAAWHLMVWASGMDGRFDVAWSVLRRMRSRKIPVTRALVIIMERYVAADLVDKAIKTFHAMEKFNIYAHSAAFYALLHALCQHRYVEEAEQVLFLDRKLFPLETKGFNMILDGWCNTVGDLIEAKRVWREMSACCIHPDSISYRHMICCASKVGNLYDSLRLYDEMKNRGFVPDLTIYNSLAYVLTRDNCLKDAQGILDKIKEAGLHADESTYNSIILPLCESQKLDEAHGVLREMVESGLEPTVETYNSFAMVEGVEGTLALIEKMKRVGCGPCKETFIIILDKFFRLDQPNNALRLWTYMRRYEITPNCSLYQALIKGLLSCRWYAKAQTFYEEMKSKGFPADPKSEKLLRDWRASLEVRHGRGDKKAKSANAHLTGGRTLFGNGIFN